MSLDELRTKLIANSKHAEDVWNDPSLSDNDVLKRWRQIFPDTL